MSNPTMPPSTPTIEEITLHMKTFIADAVDSVFKVVDLSSQTHEEDLLREMQELLLVIAVR